MDLSNGRRCTDAPFLAAGTLGGGRGVDPFVGGARTTLDYVNSFPHLRNKAILPRQDTREESTAHRASYGGAFDLLEGFRGSVGTQGVADFAMTVQARMFVLF